MYVYFKYQHIICHLLIQFTTFNSVHIHFVHINVKWFISSCSNITPNLKILFDSSLSHNIIRKQRKSRVAVLHKNRLSVIKLAYLLLRALRWSFKYRTESLHNLGALKGWYHKKYNLRKWKPIHKIEGTVYRMFSITMARLGTLLLFAKCPFTFKTEILSALCFAPWKYEYTVVLLRLCIWNQAEVETSAF